MHKTWMHIATVFDGQPYFINRLNIWEHKWVTTGEGALVKDPLYGQQFTMHVYIITNDGVTIRFAAGEFSNCVWGIYQEI